MTTTTSRSADLSPTVVFVVTLFLTGFFLLIAVALALTTDIESNVLADAAFLFANIMSGGILIVGSIGALIQGASRESDVERQE